MNKPEFFVISSPVTSDLHLDDRRKSIIKNERQIYESDASGLDITPGYGERLLNKLHYSQAVKIGDRVEISGQGGWDDDLQIPESINDAD